ERGPGFVDALDGMFAVAVWDTRADRLVLARDRMGEKPLYYAHTPDAFLFASEPKAILATGPVPPVVDGAAGGGDLRHRCGGGRGRRGERVRRDLAPPPGDTARPRRAGSADRDVLGARAAARRAGAARRRRNRRDPAARGARTRRGSRARERRPGRRLSVGRS